MTEATVRSAGNEAADEAADETADQAADRATPAGDLSALWSAESIAIIGASTKPSAPGHAVLRYLDRYGYRGTVVPIHPTATEMAGRPAWPSLHAYGRPVELALILVPAPAAPDAVADCAAAGVRVAIVGSSGFAETGPAGRALQDELVAVARRSGLRLVGPNCIGALGVPAGLVASFSPLFGGADTELVAGGLGFASASGALGFGTVSLALARGMGLCAAVSTGNEADVSALAVLAALAADPACTALIGYLESLAGAAELRALAAAASAHDKPVALLVAGVSASGARAAASHTGALATGDRVVDGVLRQHGIVRVADVDDLLDVGDALALIRRRPDGDRVAVITTSGGSGILAADEVERAGLRLANLEPATVADLAAIVPPYGSVDNPVDVTATVMNDRTLVGRALDAVAGDPGVDALVVCFCVLVGDDVDAIVTALASALARHGKPIVVARTGADHLAPAAGAALRAAGIPSYPTPARAVRVLAALHRARPRAAVPVGAAGESVAPPAIGETEPALKARLGRAGIRVPGGTVVSQRAEVNGALERCGGSAVFKVVAPGLAHKTEVGGVVVGVKAGDADTTFDRLMSLPGAAGVLIEEQIDGAELLVGVAQSPLGPLLTVGIGGVLTELVDDAAVRLLPVSRGDVVDMIDQTRVGRRLAGVRGGPPGDRGAFIDLVLRVADIAAGWPGDLDLNPVVVGPRGAVVLDAAFLPQAG